MPETLLATQKSALTEALVAHAIHLQSGGRVRIARPRPDDHGVDLRAYVAGAPPTVDLQVKSSYTLQGGNRHEFRVDTTTIPRDASRYFVLAVVGTDDFPGLGDRMWLIPGPEIKRRARGKAMYVFAVYLDRPEVSQWDRFEIRRSDLGAKVVALLRGLTDKPLPRGDGKISRIAQGEVVEDAVTFSLITGSDGRLAVLRPFADTAGVDLEVLALDSCASAGMQVKGQFVASPRAMGRAQVREVTFRGRRDRYLLVAPYLRGAARLGPVVWVLREDVFARLARRRAGVLEMAASPAPRSRDRWAPYRYSPKELAALFERIIAVCAVGRVRELPDTGR